MTSDSSTAKTSTKLPGLSDEDVQRIIDFWFAGCEPGQKELKQETVLRWFRRSDEFDAGCCQFKPLVESLSAHTPETITALATTPTRTLALLLLLDQLPRNIFRAPHSAVVFRTYDPLAQAVAFHATSPDRRFHYGEAPEYEFRTNALKTTWFILPFVHSEDLELHRRGREVVKGLKESVEEEAKKGNVTEMEKVWLEQSWDMQKKALDEHEDVVVKYGRYPHRNAVLGRETTEAEKVWLETAPEWAKQ